MSNLKQAELCIVGGAGHVGLPLALVFAAQGLSVLIYDLNGDALKQIEAGVMPFMEAGAEEALKKALDAKLLSTTTNPAEIAGISTVIVTIGTPVDEYHNPVYKAVHQCFEDLLPYLSDGQLVILRSTVYPGTTDWLHKFFSSKAKALSLAFCPERVLQGKFIEEIANLPQIVSGTTPEAERRASELFLKIAPEVVSLKPIEAEFAKLFNNAYRYIQFAIANEFYMIMQSAGVDYNRVLAGMSKNYPRAQNIPRPGFAAGPCLIKDTLQLSAFSKNRFTLGHSAMQINEGLVLYLIDEIAKEYDLGELKVGLLGMSFKSESDDTRSSLSYKLKKALQFRAAEVHTTDPFVKTDKNLQPLETVVEKSDLFILCVPHKAYQGLDLKGKPVVDIWGQLPQEAVRQDDFSAALPLQEAVK